MSIVRRRMRRGGLIGTAVIGGAGYAIGKSRGEKAGMQQAQSQQEPTQQAPQSTAPEEDPMEQLERLGRLHANGTLTDEEFAEAKRKILG